MRALQVIGPGLHQGAALLQEGGSQIGGSHPVLVGVRQGGLRDLIGHLGLGRPDLEARPEPMSCGGGLGCRSSTTWAALMSATSR